MNDYGKPQNDKAHQDDQAHELIEQLNLLDDVDRRITPEHVAKRFRELLDDIGYDGPPSPAADQPAHGILDQPGCGPQLTGLWRECGAEHWRAGLLASSSSLVAAVEAARGAAADIVADAQLKAKTASDELRRVQEAVADARQQAEQFVADARAEADKALERAIKMIKDAEDQAKQILNDARNEAEQIVTAARSQQVQVHQATWAKRRLKVYGDMPEVFQPAAETFVADQYIRLVYKAVLGMVTPVFVATPDSQEPPGLSATAALWQPTSMATDDTAPLYGAALYRGLACERGMAEAARAIINGCGGIPATYQSTRLAGAGSVGSAAWLWKLAAVPSDLDMVLARYGELDERALADAGAQLWKLVARHDLDGLLGRHLGHLGQDAPVDEAGTCLLCLARGGEEGISGGKAEAADCEGPTATARCHHSGLT